MITLTNDSDQTKKAAATQGVLLAEGSDRLPNQTAEDWVTYADHVVIVSATSEQEVAPDQVEIDRGEGLIGRNVNLKVDKVLWSRDGALKAAPKTWEYPTLGWQFKDDDLDNRQKMAMADSPRLEKGHSYIMAIMWEAAQCPEGDEKEPAGWFGLGEGSEIPYDNGIIGNGENEGSTHKVSKAGRAPLSVAAATEDDPNAGLEERLAGQSVTTLVAELEAAKPVEKEQFREPAPCG
ncbi:hypothetical protein [Streptomyces sp. NPDC090026]|uniref:hypothetical protein n=1 Tax=Streptomyces sp. NPDC090026 TaxID=3365923 RepID=UPI00382C82D4